MGIDDDGHSGPYVVRRPRPEDLPALATFASLIWPDAPPDRLARRWWWRGADEPHCIVAEHRPSGEIAALCGERRIRFLLDSEVVPASTIFDWYVAPAHSGHALGRRLVEWSRREHPVQYTTSISASAITAFGRLGFSAPCSLPLFFAAPPMVAAIAALRRRNGTVTERPIDGDLTDIDRIWAANATARRVMMVRDAAQLRAHVQLAPQCRYRLLVCRQGATPLGYLLYRVLARGSLRRLPWVRIGMLTDFLTVPDAPEVLGDLVRAAAGDLTAQACAGMMMLTSSAEHIAILNRLGFASAHLPILGSALRGLGTHACHWSNRPLPGFLQDWHLTLADNDLDLVRTCGP